MYEFFGKRSAFENLDESYPPQKLKENCETAIKLDMIKLGIFFLREDPCPINIYINKNESTANLYAKVVEVKFKEDK